MKTAEELRQEASRLRALAHETSDPTVLAALCGLIDELEKGARELDGGSADDEGD